jgi:excisionase family DNA binding protein
MCMTEQSLQAERLLIPIPDVARMLGVGRTTVYQLVAEDRLVRVNIGARALITNESLRHYVDALIEGRGVAPQPGPPQPTEPGTRYGPDTLTITYPGITDTELMVQYASS